MLYNLSSSGAQKSSGVGRILQRDMVAQRKHCAMIGPSPGMPPPLFCSVLHSYTVFLPQMSFACLFSEQSFCCVDAEMEFGCPFAQVAELPIKDMLTCRSCLTAFWSSRWLFFLFKVDHTTHFTGEWPKCSKALYTHLQSWKAVLRRQIRGPEP